MQHITQLAEQLEVTTIEIKSFLKDPSIKQLTTEQVAKVIAHFNGDTPTEQPGGELQQRPPANLAEEQMQFTELRGANDAALEQIALKNAALEGLSEAQTQLLLTEVREKARRAAIESAQVNRLKQDMDILQQRLNRHENFSLTRSLNELGLNDPQQNFSALVALQQQAQDRITELEKK